MDDYHPKCSIGTGPGGGDRKFWSVAGKGLNIPVASQDAARRLANDLNAAAQIQRETTRSLIVLVIGLAMSAGVVIGAALMHVYK